MVDPRSCRHPRKQLRGALILDPTLRPGDKGVVDIMVGNGGADRVQMGNYIRQDRLSAGAKRLAFSVHSVAERYCSVLDPLVPKLCAKVLSAAKIVSHPQKKATDGLLSVRLMPVMTGSSKRMWCGREDSNFHGLSPTTTSTLRVYQFRHGRT